MEVRGIEPLTSGLQSPRSAKLSYTPQRNNTKLINHKIGSGPE